MSLTWGQWVTGEITLYKPNVLSLDMLWYREEIR